MGPLTFGKENGMVFLGRDLNDERDYSEETAGMIDAEITRIIAEAYTKATSTLTQSRDKLDLLAKTLLEKETMEAADVRRLLSLPALPEENGVVPTTAA